MNEKGVRAAKMLLAFLKELPLKIINVIKTEGRMRWHLQKGARKTQWALWYA